MMLLDYIKMSRRQSRSTTYVQSDSVKDMWNSAVNRYGLIGTIVLLPFYLCYLAITVALFILCLPFILGLLVVGIVFYIPISLIISITIDLVRQMFHFITGGNKRNLFSWERFEKWKFTDKITDWWEIIPYGMSLGGYKRYKENVKLYGDD
jgi:hypothetical protein